MPQIPLHPPTHSLREHIFEPPGHGFPSLRAHDRALPMAVFIPCADVSPFAGTRMEPWHWPEALYPSIMHRSTDFEGYDEDETVRVSCGTPLVQQLFTARTACRHAGLHSVRLRAAGCNGGRGWQPAGTVPQWHLVAPT